MRVRDSRLNKDIEARRVIGRMVREAMDAKGRAEGRRYSAARLLEDFASVAGYTEPYYGRGWILNLIRGHRAVGKRENLELLGKALYPHFDVERAKKIAVGLNPDGAELDTVAAELDREVGQRLAKPVAVDPSESIGEAVRRIVADAVAALRARHHLDQDHHPRS